MEKTMKTDKVKWHRYPEEKPVLDGAYIVRCKSDYGTPNNAIIDYYNIWSADKWKYETSESHIIGWYCLLEPEEDFK